jgi:hypothetical protein
MYICIYIYTYVYTYIYIHIYKKLPRSSVYVTLVNNPLNLDLRGSGLFQGTYIYIYT